MKQRIESAGAKLVPVPRKLLDKPEAKNRPLRSMVQDVKADQTAIEVLVRSILLLLHSLHSNFVIEIRYTDGKLFCQGRAFSKNDLAGIFNEQQKSHCLLERAKALTTPVKKMRIGPGILMRTTVVAPLLPNGANG